ncbi:MAG: polysaccharide biosynthesis protein [Tannerellaceae bacterium]
MLDLSIISAIYLSTGYIQTLFTSLEAMRLHSLQSFLLYISVFTVAQLLFRTYSGIIRYTGVEDALRLTWMISSSTTMLLLLNFIAYGMFGFVFYHPIFIILESFIIFAMLFLLRLAVKITYLRYIRKNNKHRKKVLILGAETNSLMLATALRNEMEGKYEPVALIDLHKQIVGKSLSGLPIEAWSENIAALFAKYHAHTLVVPVSLKPRLKELAGILLNLDIQILTVSQFEKYTGKATRSPSAHIQSIQIEDLLGREPISTDSAILRHKLQGTVVLVTGAAGSIGSEIARQVASFTPATLLLLDQAESPLYEIHLEISKRYPNLQVEALIGDITNRKYMQLYFEQYRPQYVYHAAAYKHVPMMERYPSEAIRVNVGGTRNIADLSVRYGVKKFVMVSTDKAVNPTNVMGTSKRMAEIYVQSLFHKLHAAGGKHTRFVTTRFGNVLGSNGSVVPLFKRQIAEGGPVTLTHRDITRYFMTIPEACNLVLEAGCMGKGGEIYIFDMGQPIKIYDLAARMITLSGLRPGHDIEIRETGLRPGEKLYEELLNDSETTLPTHHPKIKVAQVRHYDYDEVLPRFDSVIRLGRTLVADNPMVLDCTLSIGTNDDSDTFAHNMHVVSQMKAMVPEFKSKNSVYECLD